MLKTLLSHKAAEDLKNIGRYTEDRWGKDQRNRYLSKMDDGIQTLAKHPLTGQPCDEILSGYRKYHVGKHLIFYTYDPTKIFIVRILHERMDFSAHVDEH